jgi:methylglutaconyl-CoA hydratase
MTDKTSVILEKRGQAYWITINRPDQRNALNGDVISALPRAIATRMTTIAAARQ